jgi:hypothetical protein
MKKTAAQLGHLFKIQHEVSILFNKKLTKKPMANHRLNLQ